MNGKSSIERHNRRYVITTPFPTPDEVAAMLGIPPKRVAELRQMMAEIHAEIRDEDARREARVKHRTTKSAKKK